MKSIILFSLLLMSCTTHQRVHYPEHWWKVVDKNELHWWEISPDTASKGEVILSKRNELGILSNFASTPFTFEDKRYATLEGLWQSMKFPEDKNDPRYKAGNWPYTRLQVEQMDGFAAKKAGDFGSQMMRKLNIDWVSYKGKRFIYKTKEKGEHYKIILAAMKAKLSQNPQVQKVLLSTGDLILKPDHKVSLDDPPAWKYYDIWMELREKLKD